MFCLRKQFFVPENNLIAIPFLIHCPFYKCKNFSVCVPLPPQENCWLSDPSSLEIPISSTLWGFNSKWFVKFQLILLYGGFNSQQFVCQETLTIDLIKWKLSFNFKYWLYHYMYADWPYQGSSQRKWLVELTDWHFATLIQNL